MIKLHPNKYEDFIDKMSSKFYQSSMVFGKPNLLVSDVGIQNGRYMAKTLCSYNIQELISMVNTYSAGKSGQTAVMKKIFL